VLPGFSPTDLVAGLVDKNGGRGITKQIPLRTMARVEEVAQVACFLAGPDSSHMTATLVVVDGGASSTVGVGAPL